MKYCKATTEKKPIVSAYTDEIVEDINHRIAAEDDLTGIQLPLFVNDETVMNFDLAEAKKAENENRKPVSSMDIAFGITGNEPGEKQLF